MEENLDLLYKESPEVFPKTIAIACDGNRRWAKARGLKEIEGHRTAVENMKSLVSRAGEFGVKSITFWIFSTENFKRNKDFINDIYTLAREYLQSGKYFQEISDLGGRVAFIGDVKKFPKDIYEKIAEYVEKSKKVKSKIEVNFALGYGGRDEILRAVKGLISKGIKENELTEEVFSGFLDMKDEIDLLIRTGGMIRTSGFLPWQSIYAEMYFTDTLCPDFTQDELDKAINYFITRIRNFGR